MVDIPTFEWGFCVLGNPFPNLVLHVVGTQHNHCFAVPADGFHVRSHEEDFQLDDVELLFVKYFCQPLFKIFGDETLCMVRLPGE